jgi:hypothetical protein
MGVWAPGSTLEVGRRAHTPGIRRSAPRPGGSTESSHWPSCWVGPDQAGGGSEAKARPARPGRPQRIRSGTHRFGIPRARPCRRAGLRAGSAAQPPLSRHFVAAVALDQRADRSHGAARAKAAPRHHSAPLAADPPRRPRSRRWDSHHRVARTLVDLADVLSEGRVADAVNEAEVRQVLDLDSVEATLERLRGRRGGTGCGAPWLLTDTTRPSLAAERSAASWTCESSTAFRGPALASPSPATRLTRTGRMRSRPSSSTARHSIERGAHSTRIAAATGASPGSVFR